MYYNIMYMYFCLLALILLYSNRLYTFRIVYLLTLCIWTETEKVMTTLCTVCDCVTVIEMSLCICVWGGGGSGWGQGKGACNIVPSRAKEVAILELHVLYRLTQEGIIHC